MIVVTNDYGELGHAMAFLEGQSFAATTETLLPLGLYEKNKSRLPITVRPYGKVADILSIAEAHNPDLVCLFSGYLLSPRPLQSGALAELLAHFRASRTHVVTSDPFLGMASDLRQDQIDMRMYVSGFRIPMRWMLRLVLRFRSRESPIMRSPLLEEVTHLYPTSVPMGGAATRRIAFFNPCIIRSPRSNDDRVNARPRWLFLLSSTDFHVQRRLHGFPALMDQVVTLLRKAMDADAQPAIIAPVDVISRLQPVFAGDVDLLSFCSFREFQRRLHGAQYVFYWNAFSFSQVERIANSQPFFLLDRGHLARMVTGFYEKGLAQHLGGWEPTYVDHRQFPTTVELEAHAKAQQPAMSALTTRWKESPTPDSVVQNLSERSP